jgi:ABC-type transport system involved in multi-copper enzyme maturation permease subunit
VNLAPQPAPNDQSLLQAPAAPLRAWLALIRLSIRRQARVRQMVWIALALLALTVFFVSLNTFLGRWTLTDRRARPYSATNRELLLVMSKEQAALGRVEPASAIEWAVIGSVSAALDHSGFLMFSRWVVFAIFQTFLLPLLTLSFATDAIGSEREQRTLIWAFTRPLPRSSVYLAKWLAALPWCLGLNLAGFAAVCLAAGAPGRAALRLYWPAIFWGTLAFAALYHLIAALFRRPAIVALLYSFFFETLVSDLPGDLKRISLSFYIRSLMFDATRPLQLEAESLTVYSPVSGWTALGVLVGATVALTLIGMWVFARREYSEDV